MILNKTFSAYIWVVVISSDRTMLQSMTKPKPNELTTTEQSFSVLIQGREHE